MKIYDILLNISKINLKEEDGKNALSNDMKETKEELKEIFISAEMKFTDKQVEDVCNALLESYGKITVKYLDL
ncbi:hypothetical protein psyc5s11_26710 [Clostridium gelidum]|uniref:Uncharacterized protein n=1 Tax=Clostridium gelidum TaxID=704125 RepID=A0ABM7TC92_9CLOT|nr:hypothetical protein [Clostridium gelidum]BCZ46604.1 hypothetical protein psyc5s11_26710 [Clostridium gelidum]